MNNDYINDLIINFLSHDIDEKSVMKLAKWVNASENNRKYFETQKDIWFSASVTSKKISFDSEKAYKRFLSAKKLRDTKKRKKITFFKYLSYAAVICLICTIGVISLLDYRQNHIIADTIAVEAPVGSKTRLCLPDKTIIWLNAESSIEYSTDFGKKERLIKLDGEGYFEVSPNKKCPFVVHTDGMSIKVLGTKFNIRNYKDEENAVFCLTEGSVNLTNTNNNSHIVSPGHKVIVEKHSGQMTEYPLNTKNDLKWTEGIIFFDNCPLPMIIKELERQYNVKITIRDTALNHLKFYGMFEQKNFTITEILDILSATYKFEYIRRGSEFVLKAI